jgi:hypothetical protein
MAVHPVLLDKTKKSWAKHARENEEPVHDHRFLNWINYTVEDCASYPSTWDEKVTSP